MGRGGVARHPRGLTSVHPGHLAGADQRGTTAALRRRDPGPATAADLLVQNPQREWAARTPSHFLEPVLPDVSAGTSQPAAPRRSSRKSALSLHCRSCGRSLAEAAERKIGRHLDCPATFDEKTMAMLREWRRQEAADQKLPAYCVFTDATLIAIAEARPRSVARADQGAGPWSRRRQTSTASTCWRSWLPRPTVRDHLRDAGSRAAVRGDSGCRRDPRASGSEQSNTVHVDKKCLHRFAILPRV